MPSIPVLVVNEAFMSAVQAGAYASGGQVLGLAAGGQAHHHAKSGHDKGKSHTLKDAIDPNGILSAGRYDIWPKHLRGQSR